MRSHLRKKSLACRDWAASKGGTMSSYVLDTAGKSCTWSAWTGTSNDLRTALMKAQTALRDRQPTSIGAAQVKNNPGGLPRGYRTL